MTTTNDIERLARIRVPHEPPSGVVGRLVAWYARRTFGDLPDPVLVMDHHRKIMFATQSFESKVAK